MYNAEHLTMLGLFGIPLSTRRDEKKTCIMQSCLREEAINIQASNLMGKQNDSHDIPKIVSSLMYDEVIVAFLSLLRVDAEQSDTNIPLSFSELCRMPQVLRRTMPKPECRRDSSLKT